ncbi:MAG: hypothetical protein H0W21_04805 [Actinobacteria bacterium]|nr:hypothetical protein [Actinomycetota bacterium]
MASNAGHREPPAWSLNLHRQPRCRALVEGHWPDVHARFAKRRRSGSGSGHSSPRETPGSHELPGGPVTNWP